MKINHYLYYYYSYLFNANAVDIYKCKLIKELKSEVVGFTIDA